MIAYWFYKFDVEDRDIGTVEYASFDEGPCIKYPVVSLCFYAPFSKTKIAEIYPDLSIEPKAPHKCSFLRSSDFLRLVIFVLVLHRILIRLAC